MDKNSVKMTVKYGKWFRKKIRRFVRNKTEAEVGNIEILKILDEFTRIVQNQNYHERTHIDGLTGLVGRNKKSNNVHTDDPEFMKKTSFANRYKLWHYHLGLPKYDESKPDGDKTSEYILHYQLLDNVVRILDCDRHPPFKFPKNSHIFEYKLYSGGLKPYPLKNSKKIALKNRSSK